MADLDPTMAAKSKAAILDGHDNHDSDDATAAKAAKITSGNEQMSQAAQKLVAAKGVAGAKSVVQSTK